MRVTLCGLAVPLGRLSVRRDIILVFSRIAVVASILEDFLES